MRIIIFFIEMNETGNSFGSNPASLKGKLQTLEVCPPLYSNKSKISLMNSTITRSRYRFCEVKRTHWSQCLLWRLQMSKKVYQMNLSALNSKCKMKLTLGKDILISKRQKTAEYNNRSPLWKERRLPSNSNSLVCRGELQNLRCRWEVKVIDLFQFHLINPLIYNSKKMIFDLMSLINLIAEKYTACVCTNRD